MTPFARPGAARPAAARIGRGIDRRQLDLIRGELRPGREDRRLAVSVREHLRDVVDRHARPADAGRAAEDVPVDRHIRPCPFQGTQPLLHLGLDRPQLDRHRPIANQRRLRLAQHRSDHPPPRLQRQDLGRHVGQLQPEQAAPDDDPGTLPGRLAMHPVVR